MSRSVQSWLATHGPDRCPDLSPAEARAWVARFTQASTENFSVATRLLPVTVREDFAAIYAFCRWADDLADEPTPVAPPSELLRWWSDELERCYAGRPRHPVFVALRVTIEKHDLPPLPFDDLLSAFEQDQRVSRYETWGELLDYCTRSANPVGRLVLMLFGHRDSERFALSDATCTALQLTNFWQDVRHDILERGRVYLPRDVASAEGLELDVLASLIRLDEATRCVACGVGTRQPPGASLRELTPAYRATLRTCVARTWPMFAQGRALWPAVDRSLRSDLELFTLGGEAVLRKIEARRFDTHLTRPTVGWGTKAGLFLRVALARALAR